MFHRLSKRMTPSTLIATLALVFAMTGGAYAASKYVITSTKQISPKVLKSLKGATGATGRGGATGATGPAGPAGPAGPQGAAGANGTNGTNGEPGKTGEPGASVTSAKASISTCPEGGAEFTAGSSKTHACNGKEGSPWTAGGTLPVGATETGVLAYPDSEEFVDGTANMPISFPIQLAAPLEEADVEVVKKETSGSKCTGAPEKPTAPSGVLCVYLAEEPPEEDVLGYGVIKGGEVETPGASTAGAIVTSFLEGKDYARLYGTWAVTG
jgi:hypothetical protein